MQTTIQISDRTLEILKKVKEEFNTKSYEEAIKMLVFERTKCSFAGCLGKKPTKTILKDLRDKHDRI